MLWEARDHAVRDPAYDLESLTELDERLVAHLDGLRSGGDAAYAIACAPLDQPEVGDVFAVAVLATERGDIDTLARMLDGTAGTLKLARGVVSGLGFCSFEAVSDVLPGLVDDANPAILRFMGIAACAAHRRDPGPLLGYALSDPDPLLRARAYRAAGELGRTDLTGELTRAANDPDEACRFWSAWSATLLGAPEGPRTLLSLVGRSKSFGARAALTAVRKLGPRDYTDTLRWMMNNAPRAALFAIATIGDPTFVPWVIEQTREVETARASGRALSILTGVDLPASNLHARPPAGFSARPSDDPDDEDVSMDPDEHFAWPNPQALTEWWRKKESTFTRHKRYLMGQEMTDELLEAALRGGSQPVRASAAEELVVRDPGRMLFEVRAPGWTQAGSFGARRPVRA